MSASLLLNCGLCDECASGYSYAHKKVGRPVRGHGDLLKGIEQEVWCPRCYSSRGVEDGWNDEQREAGRTTERRTIFV